MRQSTTKSSAYRTSTPTSPHRCCQIRSSTRAGRIEDAQEALATAEGVAAKNDERFWQPELHRLSAELALSRAQGARSLELRAAMTACRWASGPDERKRAQGQLAELYGWFSEGFDTRDLREARALLRDPGHSGSGT